MSVNTITVPIVVDTIADSLAIKKRSNKDLTKTRLCVFNQQGKCGYGEACVFAHAASEVRTAPDLKKTQMCTKFLEGQCSNKSCNYAHGEDDLRERPTFKKKPCKWHSKGLCRNGASCGFAHGGEELRVEPSPPEDKTFGPPPGLAPPPGLLLEAPEPEVPEPKKSPEADYFRFMAARGAAPLNDQVKIMASAIVALQTKLAQLEDMMMHTQVAQMKQTILELTNQCQAVESGLGMKARLNAKAAPFVPSLNAAAPAFVPGLNAKVAADIIASSDKSSDDSTSVGSD